MLLVAMVAKNLLHRPVRSLLTIVGIAIGVAAVVSMTSIAAGFERSWQRVFAARGTDAVVAKFSGDSPLPESFSESVAEEVRTLPHVQDVAGDFIEVTGVEDMPLAFISGWPLHSFLWDHLQLVKGRWPTNATEKAVVLGQVLADAMRKQVGDPVQIETGRFTVCGVFASSSFIEGSSIIMPLPLLQRLSDDVGNVKYLDIKVAPHTTARDIHALCATIQERYPSFKAYAAEEVTRNNRGVQLAKAMSWATSLIALLVGAIGVANTVLMSIFERTHEFGILLAIGWRRSRIVRMILWESFVLSFLGGVGGCVLGVGAIRCMQLLPLTRGQIEGDVTPWLQPTEAIRHE